MNTLRIKHRLTAYHLRNRLNRSTNYIGICGCGWRSGIMRTPLSVRARRVLCIRGHRWEPWKPMHTGPIGFEESEDTLFGHLRQCERCYRCETR